MNEMDGRLSQLEKEVRIHSQENLTTPQQEGKWSVIQVMSHLYDSELSVMAYIQKKTTEGNRDLKKTGLKNWFKSVSMGIAFKSPFKFKSPEVVAHPSNDWIVDDLFQQWNAWRTKMRSQLMQIDHDVVDKGIFKHPYAGRLNLWQTFDFFKNHFDRHHKQIIRILASYD